MSKGYQKFGLLKLFLNAGDSLVSNTGSPAFLSFFLHTHTHLQSSLETFDICSSFILCQVLLAPWLSFIICTRIHVYTHVHICMHYLLCGAPRHLACLVERSPLFGAPLNDFTLASCSPSFLSSRFNPLSWLSSTQFMRLSSVAAKTLSSFGSLSMPAFLAMSKRTRPPRPLSSLLVNRNPWCQTVSLSAWSTFSPHGNTTGPLWAKLNYMSPFPVFLTACLRAVRCGWRRWLSLK